MDNRIKELRKNKGLTLKELAVEFNEFTKKDRENIKTISYSTLSRWEQGVTEPSLNTWQKLADYFDVPIPYLQGLGMSKQEAIDILAQEILKPENRLSPWGDYDDEYNLGELLGSWLHDRLEVSDQKYLTKNDTQLNADEIYDKAIKTKDINFFKAIIKKYVNVVNDYHFLSTLNISDEIVYMYQFRNVINSQIREYYGYSSTVTDPATSNKLLDIVLNVKKVLDSHVEDSEKIDRLIEIVKKKTKKTNHA
ncbi:helix-turn-helix domain-containing protein [Ligilactobacillus murinus]|uniref:helix-turn-helix domain-containing protein n=1 Tax=Ligilactobacillus murinus TaxID=1622 RepID=UPI00109432B6|nr:helix-turn-helix transcriptional regulator [Ligilactobacillus murinus]TGY53841.1 XRE family transcriptional regulator [Ligilactobacillus murinus]